MAMEKRGVTSDEVEPPKTKQASDGGDRKNAHSCGNDTASKLADAAADAARKNQQPKR